MERASARFDDLEKLFEQLRLYVRRLTIRVQGRMGPEAKDLAVRALVQMLKTFMLATKMMKESHLGAHT